ncbi:MAG: helix-hairpin-helix domain-containing protein [Paludibacter sp.]|nr:helix-hairpin-helix domain-containing protein [Paludibacter sp.]MDD4198278.1 helix-hairpin-helix domain-containing protein [Paludibacter sp.]MDD4426986.1 helix-hairpin-helix domain-containing protein [Paludibacter sp.]
MWKNFFFFSGSQRVGIMLLIFLIVLFSIIHLYLPHFSGKACFCTDSLCLTEFEAFKMSLISLDSMQKKARFQLYGNRERTLYHSRNNQYTPTHSLFLFNPNLLDSGGFITLGLKSYVASNILKYRRRGGKFLDKTDFSRIYGISEGKYAELAPFIELPSEDSIMTEVKPDKDAKRIPGTIVELNTVDSAELMQIKGIGKGYACSIIRFRQQAGGFVCTEQLLEIYGMTQKNYERIKPYCAVNADLVRKINVNTASVDKLRAHPYLNFYQAKQIYELRRKKGKLSGLSDLKGLSELNDSILMKIMPYLRFD